MANSEHQEEEEGEEEQQISILRVGLYLPFRKSKIFCTNVEKRNINLRQRKDQ